MLDQNFIAGFDDGRHRQMIRHGRACGFYNAFRIDSVVRTDGLLQRRVPIAVVAIDFELLQIDR
jgi:hypothetical protein